MDYSKLDIEFLIDKSGSMSERDCPGGKSRWAYCQETTLALAALCEKHDPDGITVVPFAGNFKVHEGVTAASVAQVFQEHAPMGSTNTANVLGNRLDAYFARKAKGGEVKSTCLLVMTDGAPDDQQAVADVIIAATKKMDRDEELAISFIQVGTDVQATKFLQWLDDGLVAKGAKFDIVDTVKIAEVENFTVEQLIEKAFTD